MDEACFMGVCIHENVVNCIIKPHKIPQRQGVLQVRKLRPAEGQGSLGARWMLRKLLTTKWSVAVPHGPPGHTAPSIPWASAGLSSAEGLGHAEAAHFLPSSLSFIPQHNRAQLPMLS